MTIITVAVSSSIVQRNKAVVAAEGRREAARHRRAKRRGSRRAARHRRREAEEAEANWHRRRRRSEPTEQARHRRRRTRRGAKQQEQIADEAERLAEDAKKAEEYEAYVAQIGLAAAKINDNAYDYALQLLEAEQAGAAELGMGPARTTCASWAPATYKAAGPVDAVAYSPDGKSFATRRSGRQADRPRRADRRSALRKCRTASMCSPSLTRPTASRSPAAAATRRFKIIDAANGRVLDDAARPHRRRAHACASRPTASSCSAARTTTRPGCGTSPPATRCKTFKGHSWWVWAAEFSPDANRIVTAGQDGKAIVWQKGASERSERQRADIRSLPAAADAPSSIYAKLTEFTGHDGAVYTRASRPMASWSPRAATTSS